MTPSDIATLDKSNMHDVLANFSTQIEEGVALGRTVGELGLSDRCRHIVILGMGGSAIGGDLIRSYLCTLNKTSPLIISVVRNYTLPDMLTRDDLVIASSYSGNTEETLSAFRQAVKHTPHVLCMSSGGELTMQARAHSFPLITLPTGLQPRCAVGYSFFPLLTVLGGVSIVGPEAATEIATSIGETLELVRKQSAIFSEPDAKNPALALAEKLVGTIPVIYAPAEGFDAVSVRWRNQLHENAKQVAFGNVLPEMNHNEIESWLNPKRQTKKFSVVTLRDIGEHPRVSVRFDALKTLIGKRVGMIEEVWSEGESLLARMFSLITFGDWVSYYLAILNGVDPTEIPSISQLKQILSRTA